MVINLRIMPYETTLIDVLATVMSLFFCHTKFNIWISFNNVMSTTDIIIYTISIITLMIVENRTLWLARSFASSHYNHRAVIITLKASSFPPSKWQPDLSMFRSRKLINNSIFSNNESSNECNYTKIIRRGDYWPIFTSPEESNC